MTPEQIADPQHDKADISETYTASSWLQACDHSSVSATGPEGLDLKQDRASAGPTSLLSGGAHCAGLGAGLRCSCARDPTARAGADTAEQGAGSWRVVPMDGAGALTTMKSLPEIFPRRKFTRKYFALRLLKIDPG